MTDRSILFSNCHSDCPLLNPYFERWCFSLFMVNSIHGRNMETGLKMTEDCKFKRERNRVDK